MLHATTSAKNHVTVCRRCEWLLRKLSLVMNDLDLSVHVSWYFFIFPLRLPVAVLSETWKTSLVFIITKGRRLREDFMDIVFKLNQLYRLDNIALRTAEMVWLERLWHFFDWGLVHVFSFIESACGCRGLSLYLESGLLLLVDFRVGFTELVLV